MSKKVCIACGNEDLPVFQYEKWGCQIFKCSKCGLGTSETPSNFDPAIYYNEEYFQGGHKDGYADYQNAEEILKKEFSHSLKQIKKLKSEGKLLEIGCAYGFFLDLAKHHYTCTGLDISEDAIQICKSKGIDAHCLEIKDMNIDDNSIDVITLFDCIEHLDKPQNIFNEIERVSKPGSVLMITTGDWDSVLSKLMGKNWRLMTPPQHLFFYTKKSITKLLHQYGYDVIKVQYPWKVVPFELVLFQIIGRLGLKFKIPKFFKNLFFPINLFDAFKITAIKRD